MARTVIAFVGENANGILAAQSRRFCEHLPALGLRGLVLSVDDPGFADDLQRAVGEGVAFGWGYAGVGARLAVEGRTLWDAMQVPFVSVLADAPYIMPANHCVPSPWVVNAYVYREWLDLQRSHIRAPQICTTVPHGVIANPARHDTPWSSREHRMVFVKNGDDPARHLRRWALWPTRLQPVLHDSAAVLCQAEPQPILPVVQACLAAHGIWLDGCRAVLFGLLHELDGFVRAARATAMVRALLPLAADIVGDGWEHVRGGDGRARFHAGIDAGGLDDLFARTQVVVNVTPNLASGAHERVLRGFAARCRVVSDETAHGRAALEGLPSFLGVPWHAPDLPDRMAAAFGDATPFDDRLDEAEAHVAAEHDPAVFVRRLAELAQLAEVQSQLSGYGLHAA